MAFLITIFLSSFLLFQIQPILAKMALPIFGGGAAIWTACMLFFQLFLLLGYLYSHCLTRLSKLNHQVSIHCTLIALSLLLLPITSFTKSTIFEWQTPQLEIIFSLLLSIGFPYFLLSATAPLIQKWYSTIEINKEPYRLYSLSNLASLLALLSYPFVIEPIFNTTLQANIWSTLYTLFAVFMLLSGYRLYNTQTTNSENTAKNTAVEKPIKVSRILLWLLLSATSVTVMVSTTNAMTINIPPTPFLWILPLCIYLLSYIICFNTEKWYVRKYWLTLFCGCSIASLLMFFIGTQFNIITQIVIYTLILFSACMLCHGELFSLKPKKHALTWFYLIMALGGVVGSAFTSIIAEYLFTQYYEFLIAIVLVYLLFCWSVYSQQNTASLSKQLKKHNMHLMLMAAIALTLFGGYFLKLNNLYNQEDIYTSRNFYGTLTVKDFTNTEQPVRMLFDGSTSHGTQLLSTDNTIPTSYYRENTGVSLALQHFKNETTKVGIIGLGTGTLASYGNAGDEYVFYELNPHVEIAANRYFSYLSASKADVSVRLGDARITLQNELKQQGSQQYQILIVDAFSSDSIPVHLLTLEAFELYWQHLENDGLLVLHISNNHLDLLPLVATLSEKAGMQMQHFYSASDDENEHTAEWIVVTNNQDFYLDNSIKKRATYFSLNKEQRILWTDSYSNLISIIKF
ncbi:fused MFS/spermidine synthase [Pseudoalteromonas neustonica]|uniref:Fused MFS/spermidine synthase n=1 Tax=Pseudoalteromonas neustonica TaxID=1840331 RepID=A0ABU9U6K0_9GAMM